MHRNNLKVDNDTDVYYDSLRFNGKKLFAVVCAILSDSYESIFRNMLDYSEVRTVQYQFHQIECGSFTVTSIRSV